MDMVGVDTLITTMDGVDILTMDTAAIGVIIPIIVHGVTPTMATVTAGEVIIRIPEIVMLSDLQDLPYVRKRETVLIDV